MDRQFLDYYNRELAYLRELGAEFAQSFPKVAGHLGMHADNVSDPYVERLLEGFAFLSARIHRKMDAEFPRFSQRLLEVVYPHYLAPTPSMAVVQIPLVLDGVEKGEASRAFLPRGSVLSSGSVANLKTRCNFVTAHDLEAWPIEILEATAGTLGGDLQIGNRQLQKEAKGEIRLRLRLKTGAIDPVKPCPSRLVFYLTEGEVLSTKIYEAIIAHSMGVVISHPGNRAKNYFLSDDAIRAEGFDADQALLPTDARVFQGYRLLHEYFAFPQRFFFFSVNGLEQPLRQLSSDVFELTILLDQEPGELLGALNASSFALNCVPVINLFRRHGVRLLLDRDGVEHHVVADRTRPLDFEVYRVDMVDGYDHGNQPVTSFAPFYRHVGTATSQSRKAYFTTRRESRRLSDTAIRNGGRSSYIGSEVFLSLVDAQEAPWPERIAQLSIEMLLTNRDLPLLLAVSSQHDLVVETDQSLKWAHIISGPSRPRFSLADGEMTWRLISHLSLNYLALRDQDPQSGAVLLRELLGLYSALADPLIAKHGESIVSVQTKPLTRRLPVSGPLVFGRGVGIDISVDDLHFAGASPYLFGSVLEQFLARHVSMNSFTQFSLQSAARGHLASWPPRWGGRPDA